MYIYEVNLQVKPEIKEDFQAWLEEHVQKIIDFPGFNGANLAQPNNEFGIDNPWAADWEGASFWTVHYYLSTAEDLTNYLKEHATRMREDGISKFGDAFKAIRRVIEVSESWDNHVRQA